MSMKKRRNLSGIYFRSQNEKTKEWENVCFEDLTEDEQNKVMSKRGEKWTKSLAKQLANTLNDIGKQFDIISK